jgi:hypothetical protein
MLARSLTQLLQLSLSGNNIGPAGAAGIARHLTRLQQLDVSVNRCATAQARLFCGLVMTVTVAASCVGIQMWPASCVTGASRIDLVSLNVFEWRHSQGCGCCRFLWPFWCVSRCRANSQLLVMPLF